MIRRVLFYRNRNGTFDKTGKKMRNMNIQIIDEKALYVTIGKKTFYIDDSTDEGICEEVKIEYDSEGNPL